ncbi:MAG: transcriptional regulator [Candidatus Wallbacteria bacterium HGW-Wallbacteria-1]|jgi:dTDP-4-amino-4,6-dideoxygalactose transaminase|uniref:Transcriptional regulator n=1 Tax=Candidatus Wallbacteria bacterium HGW-Wallbacteria-1 TaxID=2013854 RepID=A0A2N1PK46_9BACT|nr:MAG: transcriptional regulator [Candidatus Wallbacteria bacterium HGW-Wallbacteria-1]
MTSNQSHQSSGQTLSPRRVPLLDLKAQFSPLREEILAAVTDVFDSQVFINGPRVEALEAEITAYCNAADSVGVSSGSDALIIALMALGIGKGDEVITSTFTFFATAGAIHRVGAKPVFVDIDEKSFNIDPEKVREAITEKTKAIIPVHLFGQCAEMDPIMKLAAEHGLAVIEDAAQAIGSEYKGRRAGSMGDFGCFSFFPSKNLGGAGDGGHVTTTDPKMGHHLRVLRNHGSEPKYYHHLVGGNFRLDALQAAVLSVKLRYLDQWSEARAKNAAHYRELFSSAAISGVQLPEELPDRRHIYNQFCIRISDGRRDALREELNRSGVGCEVYYPVPLHLQKCFEYLGYRIGDMPVAERVASDILALPIYPELTAEDREYIVARTAEILREI